MKLKTVEDLIRQLEWINNAVEEGDFDSAEALASSGPTADRPDTTYPFDYWESRIKQEIREIRNPTLDIRAYILGKFPERTVWSNGAIKPDALLRWTIDQRITRESVQPVLDQLLEEGVIVYREKKLWKKEDWEAARKQRQARIKTTPKVAL